MGYDPAFFPDVVIPLPEVTEAVRPLLFNNGQPIERTRFSVIFNAERGFAHLTAHNIDGLAIIPEGVIERHSFVLDPDVPASLQVDNDRGYHRNPWDRGHMVRRRSLHWGDVAEATLADRESSFWTNIAPQHETLHDTAWGDIEDFMFALSDDSDQRACVFQAPVLTPYDIVHRNKPAEEPIQIPAGFWKIMAIKHEGVLRAAAFLVWQRDFDKPVPATFDPVLEQVRVTTIEFLTGLSFPQIIRDADPLHYFITPSERAVAAATRLIVAGPRPGPRFVRSPSDIQL